MKKKKYKAGFTLVELIAVIAILGILAVVLVTGVSGYITKAHKSKIVEQCRSYVIAIEACLADEGMKIGPSGIATDKASITLGEADNNESFKKLTCITTDYKDAYPKLLSTTSYDTALKIANNQIQFTVDMNGVLSTPNN